MQLQVCTAAGCGRLANGPRCDKHKSQPEFRRNRQQRKAYFTSRWDRLRQQILERDNHLCQACLAKGLVEIGNQIDHVKKASENPEEFWAADNLQTLCHSCHSRKTQRGQ